MELWRRLRITEIVYLSPVFLYFVFCTEYPIGAIFDENSSDIKYAFEKEIEFLSRQPDAIPIKAEIQLLKSTDSFAVSNAICSLLRKGVYGIIGVSDASALPTIQSYSNNFKVPFIALSMIQNSSSHGDFQLFMRPVYVNGLLDVIIKYGWERILYIYDTDEGLIRLQQLFQAVNTREHFIDIDVKRVQNAEDCYNMLKDLHKKDEKTTIRVFLDIPTESAETVIVKLKNDTTVMNHKFHFLLGELRIEEMNLAPFKNGGINITGFQLLNYTTLLKKSAINKAWKIWDWPDPSYSHQIPLEPALVIDAVNIFQRALKQLYKNRNVYNDFNDRQFKNMKCTDNNYVSPNNGTNMMMKLKGNEIEFTGLTGKVSFDENGFRNKFKLHLLEITMNMGLAEVGYWKRDTGLTSQEPNRRRPDQEKKKKKRIVTTIIEPPYAMYKDNATATRKPKCGRENFKGFCMEMADELEKILNVSFNICTHDVYGEQLENGTWNGMLGQLVRQEVDLAIAPITITSQRERVVDFTKPYMSLGISIMIKKTAVKKASVFSFMDPLSYEIWMCILFAYIGVSVVLFLVSRFSPTEWHVDDGASISNDFTISNSLWYSLGAFMQQGCDISPRSVSGRIVGSVWWFFTLIIISSYTANLAAFLTVERMLTPIESAEDLAKQTEIQYGILASGSTASFFQQSKFPVHERMWAYMQSASPSVFVKSNQEGIERVRKGNYAYLMESTTNKYTNMRKPCDTMQVGPNLDSKGYGIATPIGSDLRDQLTLAVLKLREAGRLEEMQKEWWEKRSECPTKENNQDGGQAELTLENVAGIFYILAGGLTLSVIIAFFEFIYKSKLDSKRSKKPFGSVLRCKARLSFRGSLDRDNPNPSSPLRKSMSTYTYTGPSHVAGADGFPDNLHTQV
ncbi:glutamate receptor-like isoform X2 [Ruditapes philippinarum]|uniref:glutamate receptor-like isoform X2 n=1 Tax=Ruditapes philippinarum TaxID=129788 RepID=UPI00295A7AE0|nr:glutamate receptor-like isoform X2 [Ruditapes philippinarum]